MTWHRRLVEHMSEQGLQTLVEHNLLLGLKEVDLPFCEHYVKSKQHRLKFARVVTMSKHILDLVHSYV